MASHSPARGTGHTVYAMKAELRPHRLRSRAAPSSPLATALDDSQRTGPSAGRVRPAHATRPPEFIATGGAFAFLESDDAAAEGDLVTTPTHAHFRLGGRPSLSFSATELAQQASSLLAPCANSS